MNPYAAATAEQQDFHVVVPTQNKTGSRFILYVGDVISPDAKQRDPRFTPGGIVKPCATLTHVHGFIPRCIITELREHHQTLASVNVHPRDRQHWLATYQVPDGLDPLTGAVRYKTIGLRSDGTHDGMLRRPCYPVDDIANLTGKGDGIVEVPVRNQKERAAAQLFLFPESTSGNFLPPPTLAELKKHFETRRAFVTNDFERTVLAAAFQAVQAFEAYARMETDAARNNYAKAKTAGKPTAIGTKTRMLFAALNLAAPDATAQMQESNLSDLTEAVKALANLAVADRAAKIPQVTQAIETAVETGAVTPDVAAALVEDMPSDDAPDVSTAWTVEEGATNGLAERVRLADGREGQVTAKLPFGKITVLLDNDLTEITVPRKEVETI